MQIWQGPTHVHGTVAGETAEGYTRYGSSCQINIKLAEAVRKRFESGKGRVINNWQRAQDLMQRLEGYPPSWQEDTDDSEDWDEQADMLYYGGYDPTDDD